MKKTLLVPLILLAGCKSFDFNQETLPVHRQVEEKLPRFELSLKANEPTFYSSKFNHKYKFVKKHAERIFIREFETNFMENDLTPKGKLVLNHEFSMDHSHNGWTLLSFVGGLGVINLFGVPTSSFTGTSNIDAKIVDNKGRVIKNYYAVAQDTEYTGVFRYDSSDCPYAAYLNSFKAALQKLVKNMYEDKENLFYAFNKSKVPLNTNARAEIKANSSLPEWLNYYLKEGSVLQQDVEYKNYIGEGVNEQATYKDMRRQLANEFFSENPDKAKDVYCERQGIKTHKNRTFSIYRCSLEEIEKNR
ncbi:MAG: hypothetical protein MJ247_04865 [Alphaproteobacteria bacterium]|nr:hypothetical protein [Alphaproteobacteria bacterium]